MTTRKRIILLIVIMITIGVIVETITIVLNYNASIESSKKHLLTLVENQADMIGSISEYEKRLSNDNNQEDFENSILKKVINGYKQGHRPFFGKTGSIVIARKEGEGIKFLVRHKNKNNNEIETNTCELYTPRHLELAFSGQSGTLIGPDCFGDEVLLAYHPVEQLANWGVVAKMDMSEIRTPLIRASFLGGLTGIFFIIIGAIAFIKVTNPIIKELIEKNLNLENALKEVKTLSGLLPICSSCKKIRDDKGYWNRIESYISAHTGAEFTHSYCNDCLEKLYPDLGI